MREILNYTVPGTVVTHPAEKNKKTNKILLYGGMAALLVIPEIIVYSVGNSPIMQTMEEWPYIFLGVFFYTWPGTAVFLILLGNDIKFLFCQDACSISAKHVLSVVATVLLGIVNVVVGFAAFVLSCVACQYR